MQDLKYDTEDCIVALATAWSPSALAVIRMTGPGCVDSFARFFSRPSALTVPAGNPAVYGQVVYGHVTDGRGAVLDEVLATVFRAPRSYTGQDSVEISCHGSLPGLRRILAALTGEGGTRGAFRPAGPGEFTLRAFLNGKLDLTRAEAVQELVAARTETAQTLALHRLSGSVEGRIRALTKQLLDLTALLNIQLDYAEDDVETVAVPFGLLGAVRAELVNLAATFRTGQVYQEGIRLVLAGRTNAGKSSLFNLLLKEDRSIVSEEHGTTRDWLESWVSLDGIPVRVFDTAGLREASNLVEREGIRRTREIIEASDVIVYLIAGDEGPNAEDWAFLEDWKADPRLLVVLTKSDLPRLEIDWAVYLRDGGQSAGAPLELSSKTGEGFEGLEAAVKARIPGALRSGNEEPVIDSLRQKNLLDRAIAALDHVKVGTDLGMPIDMIALDVKDALDALGEITGEITTADVLDHMFSRFCVGK